MMGRDGFGKRFVGCLEILEEEGLAKRDSGWRCVFNQRVHGLDTWTPKSSVPTTRRLGLEGGVGKAVYVCVCELVRGVMGMCEQEGWRKQCEQCVTVGF